MGGLSQRTPESRFRHWHWLLRLQFPTALHGLAAGPGRHWRSPLPCHRLPASAPGRRLSGRALAHVETRPAVRPRSSYLCRVSLVRFRCFLHNSEHAVIEGWHVAGLGSSLLLRGRTAGGVSTWALARPDN